MALGTIFFFVFVETCKSKLSMNIFYFLLTHKKRLFDMTLCILRYSLISLLDFYNRVILSPEKSCNYNIAHNKKYVHRVYVEKVFE